MLIIENMPVSEEKLEQFKQETRKDPTLQKLKNTILNGEPESLRGSLSQIQSFMDIGISMKKSQFVMTYC